MVPYFNTNEIAILKLTFLDHLGKCVYLLHLLFSCTVCELYEYNMDVMQIV